MKGMPDRITKYHAVILLKHYWLKDYCSNQFNCFNATLSQFRKLLLGDRRRISTTCLTESSESQRRDSASVDQLLQRLIESNGHSRHLIAIVMVLCVSHRRRAVLDSDVICFRRICIDNFRRCFSSCSSSSFSLIHLWRLEASTKSTFHRLFLKMKRLFKNTRPKIQIDKQIMVS